MENKVTLFHTGFAIIEKPDLHHGWKNADFGQGFYLSDSEEFSRRWARYRKGETTFLNIYELDLDNLNVLTLTRNEEWFSCIFANRSHQNDSLSDYDVIKGPIANDTIYDTFGITTSGILSQKEALQLLDFGPLFTQIVLKTESALKNLTFIKSETISQEEISSYRDIVAKEQEAFQKEFVERMKAL